MPRAGRVAVLLILLAAGVSLSACGGSSGDEERTGATGDQARKQPSCSPTPARSNPPISRHLAEQEEVETTIAGAEVRLQVTQSNLRTSIAGHFGVERPFTPAKGSKFLSVTYSVDNSGPAGLTPAKTINESAFVADSDGGAWSGEGLASCGGPVAASLAVVQDVDSPNGEIATGQGATTVVVFVVPRHAHGFVLKLPAQEVAFDLSPEA